MREWARKVKADPYTTNLVLRNALKSIAKVDAAGSIVTKVVVPIPAVVGTTATVGDLVWSKDPEALRKLNEERVRALGAPREDRVGVLPERLVHADAADHESSLLWTRSRNRAAPTTSNPPRRPTPNARRCSSSRAPRCCSAITRKRRLTSCSGTRARSWRQLAGNAVLVAPLDFIRSTSAVRNALAEIASRARRELGASSLVLHVSGTLSDRARQDAKGAGWTVRESGA